MDKEFLDWSAKAGYGTCTSDSQIALKEAWDAGRAKAPCAIFELVDVTDSESYYTMGLFWTQEEAVSVASSPDKHGFPPSDDVWDDVVVYEIRERKMGYAGWSVTGHVRATVTWNRKYSEDDEDDEGKWSISVA